MDILKRGEVEIICRLAGNFPFYTILDHLEIFQWIKSFGCLTWMRRNCSVYEFRKWQNFDMIGVRCFWHTSPTESINWFKTCIWYVWTKSAVPEMKTVESWNFRKSASVRHCRSTTEKLVQSWRVYLYSVFRTVSKWLIGSVGKADYPLLITRVEFPLVRALREPTQMDDGRHRDDRIIKKGRFEFWQ